MPVASNKPMPKDRIEPGLAGFVGGLIDFPDTRGILLTWTGATVLGGALTVGLGDIGLALFILIYVMGLGGWTFAEYHLHRHAMHWNPDNPKLLRWREKLLPHNNHHDQPGNPRRIVGMPDQTMPVLIAVAFFGLLCIFAPVEWAAAYTLGGGAGYMLYEIIHFAAHQWPRTAPIPAHLVRHHLIHHHRDDTVNFGVTTTIWDRIFGTLYRPGETHAIRE